MVIGWIHVLEQDAQLPERLCHAIDIVKRNANLQAQLIEDILDVSRIITELTIEPADARHRPLVETTLGGLLPAAVVKQIQLTLEMPDALPIVQGDPAAADSRQRDLERDQVHRPG